MLVAKIEKGSVLDSNAGLLPTSPRPSALYTLPAGHLGKTFVPVNSSSVPIAPNLDRTPFSDSLVGQRMNALSKTIHVVAWIICVVSSYLTLIAISFFWQGVGWAGIGLFELLKFYLPACLLLCVCPAGYLVYRKINPRDKRSLWLATVPSILLPLALYLAFQFAPHGSGC